MVHFQCNAMQKNQHLNKKINTTSIKVVSVAGPVMSTHMLNQFMTHILYLFSVSFSTFFKLALRQRGFVGHQSVCWSLLLGLFFHSVVNVLCDIKVCDLLLISIRQCHVCLRICRVMWLTLCECVYLVLKNVNFGTLYPRSESFSGCSVLPPALTDELVCIKGLELKWQCSMVATL